MNTSHNIHRLAAQLRVARKELTLEGGERKAYMDRVWSMYEMTYRRIGLTMSSPSALLKYSVWKLNDVDGTLVAFSLYKKTRFGLKFCMAGQDGSSAGKQAIKC